MILVATLAYLSGCSPTSIELLPPDDDKAPTARSVCGKADECGLITDEPACQACMGLLAQQHPELQDAMDKAHVKLSDLTCDVLTKYGKSTRAIECTNNDWLKTHE